MDSSALVVVDSTAIGFSRPTSDTVPSREISYHPVSSPMDFDTGHDNFNDISVLSICVNAAR